MKTFNSIIFILMLTLRLNADLYCEPTYPCPEIEWEETLSKYTFQMPNTILRVW